MSEYGAARSISGSPLDDHGRGAAPQSRKRKRIPIACGACRTRKSRCDGQRPQCATCVSQQLECVYAQGPAVADNAFVPKAFLDLVESRLATVEDEVRLLKGQLSDLSYAAPRAEGPRVCTAADQVSGAHEDEQANGKSPDATDGVGTVEFVDEDNWAYFGSSSNIAFTRMIREAISQLVQSSHSSAQPQTSRPAPARHSQYDLAVSRPPSPRHSHATPATPADTSDINRMPSEEEVLSLARQFFSDTGALFPYIHEQGFWETYNKTKSSGPKSVRRCWLGILNMILAMASSIGTTNEASALGERYSVSEVYFHRAQALCLRDMMSGASVEAVQVMLLMTQYLQGTQRSIKTWAIHGLAVKGAFQLGLHSEQVLQRFGPLEREIRRRVWYGCVVLDRSLSMTFGRPPAILQHLVRLPLPTHNLEIRTPNGPREAQWSTDEKSTQFWNGTITLYSITDRVIHDLHGCNLGSSEPTPCADMVSSIIQVGQQLSRWRALQPASMGIIEPDDLCHAEDDPKGWKFRVVLTLRFHNLRILAHRPILDRYLEKKGTIEQTPEDLSILSQFGHLGMTTCLQSAEKIISIVRVCTSSTGQQRGILGAWWFSLYYTFNAALTVAGVMLSQEMDPFGLDQKLYVRPKEQLAGILDDAIACISSLDRENIMVEKCVKFTATLRRLIGSIVPASSDLDSGPDTMTTEAITSATGPGLSQGEDGLGTRAEMDLFTDLTDLLPPEFHFADIDFNRGGPLMVPDFMDEFAKANAGW